MFADSKHTRLFSQDAPSSTAIIGIVIRDTSVEMTTPMDAALFCLGYGALPMATRDATGMPAPMVQILMIAGSSVYRCMNAQTISGSSPRRMGSIGQIPFSVLISFREAAAMEEPMIIMDRGVVISPIKPTQE